MWRCRPLMVVRIRNGGREFADGSPLAYACEIYIRWTKTKTSSREPTRYVVRMVCAKARVTSVRGTTAPRSEMEDFHAITQNDLLLQRSKNTVPGVVYGTGDSLTRRQEAMRELEEMWWNMWIVQALPHLVPYKRWKTEHRSLCVGYIVLVL